MPDVGKVVLDQLQVQGRERLVMVLGPLAMNSVCPLCPRTCRRIHRPVKSAVERLSMGRHTGSRRSEGAAALLRCGRLRTTHLDGAFAEDRASVCSMYCSLEHCIGTDHPGFGRSGRISSGTATRHSGQQYTLLRLRRKLFRLSTVGIFCITLAVNKKSCPGRLEIRCRGSGVELVEVIR